MGTGMAFDADGVRIVYDDVRPAAGEGEPVVLLHEFGSNRAACWRETGWYETLREAGRRVIAADARFHGESDRPQDPQGLTLASLVEDLEALLDHVEVAQTDVVGYGLGARVGLSLLRRHPGRVTAGVFGGVGDRVLDDALPERERVADALDAQDASGVEGVGTIFREVADRCGADRRALATLARTHTAGWGEVALDRVGTPVLVAAGDRDAVAGDPVELAVEFGNAEAAIVPGATHRSTLDDVDFEAAVTDFLGRKRR